MMRPKSSSKKEKEKRNGSVKEMTRDGIHNYPNCLKENTKGKKATRKTEERKAI